MKYPYLNKIFLVLVVACLPTGVAFAQKARPKTKKPIPTVAQHLIFAVMNDGKTLEPIGVINDGKIEAAAAGDGDAADLKNFAARNYKAGTAYDLIFGGTPTGKIIVKSSDPNGECGKILLKLRLLRPIAA
jgi:hypothetical protein